MKKWFLAFFVISTIFFASGYRQVAFAENRCSSSYSPTTITDNQPFNIQIQNTTKGHVYYALVQAENASAKDNINPTEKDTIKTTADGQVLTFHFTGIKAGKYTMRANDYTDAWLCQSTVFQVTGGTSNSDAACVAWIGDTFGSVPVLNDGSSSTFHATGAGLTFDKKYIIDISGDAQYDNGITISQQGINMITFPISTKNKKGQPLSNGTHVITLYQAQEGWASLLHPPTNLCSAQFAIGHIGAATPLGQACDPVLTNQCPADSACTPLSSGSGICIANSDKFNDPPCAVAFDSKGNCPRVDTAIGPIDTGPEGFIKSVFSLLLGLSGGIALFLIITSGYKLMASQGNPEAVQGARETLTSAIVGLLFIIFSFVILQIIGVTILKIPGFG